MTKEQIGQLTERVKGGYLINLEEAMALVNTAAKEDLYMAADEVRAFFIGDKLDMCSIMNAQSGRCSEDCKWCSQSGKFKTGIEAYGFISKDEGVSLALENSSKGVNRFSLVTSGLALLRRNVLKACEIYKEIKEKSDIHTCASMGLLKKPELELLKDAGVGHYHCNIETAPSYFPNLCSTHTVDQKIDTIKAAKASGLKICSGGIIGMGESMEQRLEMAFILRDLEVDSIPVNILNPVEGTDLAGSEILEDDTILTTLAIFRLINPKAQIRFAGGRNLIKHIEDKALRAGVSAALVGDYLTTLGSGIDEDKAMFKKAGFTCGK